MDARFAKNVARHIHEDMNFVKTWVARPKTTGAVLPTSRYTAKRMASVIDPSNGAKVLELGPGTGSITKAIIERGVKPENIYSVEFNASFVPSLRQKYPGVNFLQGDAFALRNHLPDMAGNNFEAVISGLPLLNFPVQKRVKLLLSLFGWVKRGNPVVQFSYGAMSPIPKRPGSYQVNSLEWIVRNVPPARIWTYRQTIR